jgi:hypothetical protein
MSSALDLVVVGVAVGGAALWLVQRFRASGRGECATGCGSCEEARGPKTLSAVEPARDPGAPASPEQLAAVHRLPARLARKARRRPLRP